MHFCFFYILPIFSLLFKRRPLPQLQFPWHLNVRQCICPFLCWCLCMCVVCGKLLNSLKLRNSSPPTFMKFNEPKSVRKAIFGDVPNTSWDILKKIKSEHAPVGNHLRDSRDHAVISGRMMAMRSRKKTQLLQMEIPSSYKSIFFFSLLQRNIRPSVKEFGFKLCKNPSTVLKLVH